MSSQSDDFARMIELLEQILDRLPPKPADYSGPVDYGYPVGHPFGPPNYNFNVKTGDYVCPTCLGGICQCGTGGA